MDGVKFDKQSARRIANVVRDFEKLPTDVRGEILRPIMPQQETVWAALTSRDSTDHRLYAWTEQQPTYDQTTLDDAADPRSGTTTDNPAVDYIGEGATDLTNTVVLLRRINRADSDSTDHDWVGEWCIVPQGVGGGYGALGFCWVGHYLCEDYDHDIITLDTADWRLRDVATDNVIRRDADTHTHLLTGHYHTGNGFGYWSTEDSNLYYGIVIDPTTGHLTLDYTCQMSDPCEGWLSVTIIYLPLDTDEDNAQTFGNNQPS